MIILVLNCGSSSLKYQLLDMKNDEVYDLLAKGLVERIGMETGCLKHQATGKENFVKEMPIENHLLSQEACGTALHHGKERRDRSAAERNSQQQSLELCC